MERDDAYLLDMLNAARKIQQFTAGMSETAFRESELHQNAVVRLIQVIGEAARQTSSEYKAAHPEIEWAKIAGMRNHVIHQYTRINLNLVWEVIQTHAPQLIQRIEPLLPPPEAG